MSYLGNRKMSPRNGRKFVVLIVARISGCVSQKDVSLEDQQEHAQQHSSDACGDGEFEFRVIATKGKGELITRPELVEVEAAIRSNDLDLLIVEDLGRLIRGAEASRLCGIAVDHGTRVIAINDCIDTWDEDWESDVIAACRDHVGHNAHTSKRLKKKLMLRFKREGAATPCPIAGYIKPEGAKTFHDWSVDEEARSHILIGAEILRKTGNCSAVADYFESVHFPVGPVCRVKKWNGAMVRRFFANPILKGKPERGNKHSVKHNETGKRRSVVNPNGPVSIDMPNLAIIPELEFDELKALLDNRNADRGRKPYSNGQDPLAGVPRKRTRFPGQHARCWYCGRIFVWGGNGIVGNLQCTGSRSYQCWNSIGLNGELFCKLVVEAIWSMLGRLKGLDQCVLQQFQDEANRPDIDVEALQRKLAAEEKELQQQKQKLIDAIAQVGPDADIIKRLSALKEKESELTIRKADLGRRQVAENDIPTSTDELIERVKSQFLELSIDSYEFGMMLPKIVPDIHVYCVRMCDGGPLFPRVKFTVDLSGSFERTPAETLREHLVRTFVVDPFELPPHAAIRDQVKRLSESGHDLTEIKKSDLMNASENQIKKSLKLQETMNDLGVSDPLIVQLSPPEDLKKLRRHRHDRYAFEPLKGYEPPALE